MPSSQFTLESKAHRAGSKTATTRPTVRWQLLNWENLAWWQRENPYIKSGYRMACASYRVSLASILSLHNESVNINLHLISGLIFCCVPVYGLRRMDALNIAPPAKIEGLSLAIHWVSVVAYLFISAWTHLMASYNTTMTVFNARLHRAAVLGWLWSSGLLLTYYTFADQPRLQLKYWICMTVIAFFYSCSPNRRPSFFWIRGRSQAAAVLTVAMLFCWIHGIVENGWYEENHRIAFETLVRAACVHLTGALCHALLVPERLRPGAFDTLGASHQIFHATTVMGAIIHGRAIWRAFLHARGVQT